MNCSYCNQETDKPLWLEKRYGSFEPICKTCIKEIELPKEHYDKQIDIPFFENKCFRCDSSKNLLFTKNYYKLYKIQCESCATIGIKTIIVIYIHIGFEMKCYLCDSNENLLLKQIAIDLFEQTCKNCLDH